MTKLLFFKQPNCTPCFMVDNFITHAHEITPDKTLILFDGNAEADELAEKFDVMTTPTLVLANDDLTESLRIVRGINKNDIQSIIDQWKAEN